MRKTRKLSAAKRKPASRAAKARKPAAQAEAAKSRAPKRAARKTAPKKPASRRATPVKPAKPPAPKRGVHDIGGLAAGPIDRSQHAPTPFEERVDALMMVLTLGQGIYKVDATRRAIEALDRGDYRHLKYYEKWIRAIRVMLVEHGVLSDAEIDARITQLRARGAARGIQGAEGKAA